MFDKSIIISKSNCSKSTTWFANGGCCGDGHECNFCIDDPNRQNLKMTIDKDTYQSHIPDCCTLRTFEDHQFIGYCWGLIAEIERRPDANCGICPYVKKSEVYP